MIIPSIGCSNFKHIRLSETILLFLNKSLNFIHALVLLVFNVSINRCLLNKHVEPVEPIKGLQGAGSLKLKSMASAKRA
jgi:hypothetical protein